MYLRQLRATLWPPRCGPLLCRLHRLAVSASACSLALSARHRLSSNARSFAGPLLSPRDTALVLVLVLVLALALALVLVLVLVLVVLLRCCDCVCVVCVAADAPASAARQ